MARVFKVQYASGPDGKRRYSAKHYVEYRRWDGKLCREPAYRDKSLSQQHLADILKREELIRAGKLQPADAEGDTLGIHALIEKWKAHMRRKGDGESHITYYSWAVDQACTACRFTDARSIDGHKAQQWLESQLGEWTNRTYNHHRGALLAFGYWLADKERARPDNPFRAIDSRNPDINARIVRRSLTEDEFRTLLEATRKGRVRSGLSGEQRYYLYLVAAYTGLRFAALVALTPADFDWKGGGSVTSSMRLQKNRRAHTVPLPPDVSGKLRRWFRGKDPNARLWPLGEWARAADLVKFDLAAARIKFVTEEGRFDFHSLRHQFATALVRGGASVAEVQQLLDHCSPTLSARYFKHLRTDELRKPVSRLPRV